MSFIKPISRAQLMMPNSIDEYVSQDNMVRFIDAFVDKVLHNVPVEMLMQKGKSIEGRPSYSPNCLCKLLIYGYFNSVSSSRKLENESKRNLEAIWLMNNLHPDHWTISDFRKDNKELIKRITIDFRKFLRDSGYIKGKSVSTDGSKIKAYASRSTLSISLIEKKLTHAEKEIERYLSQLDANDTLENEQEEMLATNDKLKNQIAALREQVEKLSSQKQLLEKLDRKSLAPADFDARIMQTKDGLLPAYNVQSTVDNDTHFILACEITDSPIDFHSLEENVKLLEEQLELIPNTCLADGGYANEEQIQSLEQQGIECIVHFAGETETKKTQRNKGITFTYNEKEDCFICSQGKRLLLVEKKCKKKNHFFSKYQCKQCSECAVRHDCTTSKKGRIIYRRLNGEWLNAYKEKMKTKEFREKFKKRKCVAEHPFGTLRYLMGQIPILLRSKEKVQVEIDLYATGYNLTRLKNVEFVPILLKKLEKWNPLSCFFVFLSIWLEKKRIYNPVSYFKIH